LLQKSEIPTMIQIGDIFYYRQIQVYNQCFYSCKNDRCMMYMYNEIIGKREAKETTYLITESLPWPLSFSWCENPLSLQW
jgi:hypothetical protein